MGFVADIGGGRRRAGGKLALGIAVLAIIALVGAFVGVKVLGSGPEPGHLGPGRRGRSPAGEPANASGPPIKIAANQVRIVDPPRGDGTELGDAGLTVDGSDTTGWSTDDYKQANFGGIKPGMGILIDLGQPTKIEAVKVVVNQTGSSVELRQGASDPGDGLSGAQARTADGTLVKGFTPIGQPFTDYDGTTMVFSLDDTTVQYLMVWITKLPPKGSQFALTVNEITVIGAP